MHTPVLGDILDFGSTGREGRAYQFCMDCEGPSEATFGSLAAGGACADSEGRQFANSLQLSAATPLVRHHATLGEGCLCWAFKEAAGVFELDPSRGIEIAGFELHWL
ncbi:hypothetical protein CVT26_014502 [Gymnopilus dilepis]|uniref:Uncharacterized protein n=1 Tax=Gymnopilus dilepis TaxID=231916 RepID=A0A409WS98_9AGAR|nr:hypothetical protein CVT26_014502 [Gymnopilus dilepis]